MVSRSAGPAGVPHWRCRFPATDPRWPALLPGCPAGLAARHPAYRSGRPAVRSERQGAGARRRPRQSRSGRRPGPRSRSHPACRLALRTYRSSLSTTLYALFGLILRLRGALRAGCHLFHQNVEFAPLAQWIEHLPSKQRVGGSNPSRGTTVTYKKDMTEEARKAPVIPSDMKAFNKKLIADFRANHGQWTGHMAGRGLLILTTTGARTGKERAAVLGYGRDGDRLIVIASD